MVIYSVNKTSMLRFQHVQTTQWLDLAQMKSNIRERRYHG